MNEIEQPTMHERIADLARSAGGTVRSSQFDGGTFYEVTVPGKGSVACTYEWGDDESKVIDILRSKMSAAGMIGAVRHQFRLDYGGGRETTVWASDAGQAKRLAGLGTPETITDLTTGQEIAGD